jgi:hypothetical protein
VLGSVEFSIASLKQINISARRSFMIQGNLHQMAVATAVDKVRVGQCGIFLSLSEANLTSLLGDHS